MAISARGSAAAELFASIEFGDLQKLDSGGSTSTA